MFCQVITAILHLLKAYGKCVSVETSTTAMYLDEKKNFFLRIQHYRITSLKFKYKKIRHNANAKFRVKKYIHFFPQTQRTYSDV